MSVVEFFETVCGVFEQRLRLIGLCMLIERTDKMTEHARIGDSDGPARLAFASRFYSH